MSAGIRQWMEFHAQWRAPAEHDPPFVMIASWWPQSGLRRSGPRFSAIVRQLSLPKRQATV